MFAASGSALVRLVTRVAVNFVGLVRTRVELVSVEVEETLSHLLGVLVWSVVAGCLGLGALVMLGLAVIVIFWDSHRVNAALLVFACYGAMTLWAMSVVRTKLRTRPVFLAATIAELRSDTPKSTGDPT